MVIIVIIIIYPKNDKTNLMQINLASYATVYLLQDFKMNLTLLSYFI